MGSTESHPSTSSGFLRKIPLKCSIFILESQENFYVGISKNLEKRLYQHINKKSYYTKHFDRFKLVYTEKFSTRKEAEKEKSKLRAGQD